MCPMFLGQCQPHFAFSTVSLLSSACRDFQRKARSLKEGESAMYYHCSCFLSVLSLPIQLFLTVHPTFQASSLLRAFDDSSPKYWPLVPAHRVALQEILPSPYSLKQPSCICTALFYCVCNTVWHSVSAGHCLVTPWPSSLIYFPHNFVPGT